ncbi:MAG: DUF2334 domain-containing protein, partial [Acidimicrobiales bacterium]
TALVDTYEPGDGAGFDGVVYVGARGAETDNQLPAAFLSDVAANQFQVLWLGAGIDQMVGSFGSFRQVYGWNPVFGRGLAATSVSYKGELLPRVATSLPLHRVQVTDPEVVTVLATATAGETATQPYAVRSRNLTYVAETPFGFLTEANNSLVVADLLFDLLDPARPEQHLALVRLEDIGPTSDPKRLRAAGDELHERGIPFAFAVYPRWRDPLGQYSLGSDVGLSDRSELVDSLKYLITRGGTMVMHGVTHQLGDAPNPDSGVSGEDFEFYVVAEDEGDVELSSPVPEDSVSWVHDRLTFGMEEFELADLPFPEFFEFPHYLASALDYQTIAPIFEARYERSSYFPGLLSGAADTTGPRTQYFPYPVHDVYGDYVVPENLGNVVIDPLSGGDERSAGEIVAAAERMLVVRDSVASFFYHPFLGGDDLGSILDEMLALGYEFVSADELLVRWK